MPAQVVAVGLVVEAFGVDEDAVLEAFAVYEDRFSLYRPETEASGFARREFTLRHASPEFQAVYTEAVLWRGRTDGAFTPHRPDGVVDLSGVVKALAIQANNKTGTLKDVEHIVLLMQENRSFDHYFGTLKSRVELQDMAVHTNVLIADYQVITDRDTTEHIQDNVYNMVMDYLACGIDPDKTMIYAHSAVPAANQLMLPFLSLVSEAELARNPTVKAEMEASGHELTGLLLTYPVHQACDILFCKGNVVPVGRDQLPHIELTRTIARRFNNRYGKVFPEVDALLSETPLLPGLDGRKMSKSYGNAINISMTAEETAKRIKKSQTDSERMITFDPENRPGVSGLLSTAAICTGRSEVEIAEEIGMGGSGQLKKYVTEAVNEYFAPIRERRQRYENDLDYVKDVLHEGNRRANEIAEQTLAEVQDAMGMVY